MTTRRDPDALLDAYLADGVDALPDRVIDAVLDEAHRTRQRAVLGPWRTSPMHGFKLALAGTAVMVVVAGLAFLPRMLSVGGPPEASPSPSSAPNASPRSYRMTVGGSYDADDGLQLTVDLPDGWDAEQHLVGDSRGERSGTTVFISIIDDTYSDPCAQIVRTPKLEPTVDAWAAALGEIPEIAATAPVPMTVAGLDATYVELMIPDTIPCALRRFYLWRDGPDSAYWPQEPNERIRVWIVDVDGQPVAIAARTYAELDPASEAETQQLLDSIRFLPDAPAASASPASP